MNREHRRALIAIIFPLTFAVIFLLLNRVMQPTSLKTEDSYKTVVLKDVSEFKLYNLDGDILCYPRAKLNPSHTLNYRGVTQTIKSFSDIRSPEFVVGSEYVATIKIQISVPKDHEYGLILPGQFCEYTMFCNGDLFAHSNSYLHKSPCYPTPGYVKLPPSETGFYQLIINLTTPVICDAGSYGTYLFGTWEHILRVQQIEKSILYSLLSFVVFIIFACVIQLLSLRKDKVLRSFLLFVVASLIRILFSDNVVAVELFGYLPYQFVSICRGMITPLFLFSMMFHIYTIYAKYFKKHLLVSGSLALLIPVINALTFSQMPFVNLISKVCEFVPYVICAYYIYCAIMDEFFYSTTVIIGLISLLSSSVISIITARNIVPGKYTYSYGIVFISFAQLISLAKTYAMQDEAEISMTEELRKQIESMQASENAFLNAQMKPHFLYNTLNTIADLCVTDSEKARGLIGMLKDYVGMVISLDNMEETVSLSKELKLARTYYKIEKERFPSIEFFEELPIRIPNIQMPPLVLQPLVENAIKHGVRKSTRSGVIIIRIKEKPDYVQFQVSDNGAGMTQEDIDKMFIVPKENKSVGIYNINKRLANLYGTGLKVESTVDLGTCISFIIPKGPDTEHIKHGAKRIE